MSEQRAGMLPVLVGSRFVHKLSQACLPGSSTDAVVQLKRFDWMIFLFSPFLFQSCKYLISSETWNEMTELQNTICMIRIESHVQNTLRQNALDDLRARNEVTFSAWQNNYFTWMDVPCRIARHF